MPKSRRRSSFKLKSQPSEVCEEAVVNYMLSMEKPGSLIQRVIYIKDIVKSVMETTNIDEIEITNTIKYLANEGKLRLGTSSTRHGPRNFGKRTVRLIKQY